MNRRDQILKKRGHSRRLLSVLLALVMLLSLLPTAVFAADPTPQTYKKVTQAPEDWSGTYLIVSEGDEAAFDSSLTAIDVPNNYKTVKIAEGTIKTTETIAVTIEKMADGNYSIKGANGKYIYQTSDANGLKTGAKATANTIALNADGTVDIVSGGAHLRFNKNSDQMRFRYFKSATYTRQQAITLYKLDAAPARQSGVISDLSTLQDGDKVVVFNPANGKTLSTEYTGHYNKGTDVTLADGKLTGFTDADKWTLGINDDGTYTFATADGKKLAMGTDFTSTPLDEVNRNWKITAVDGKDATFYIDNTGRTDKYRLQWFTSKGNWSAYTGTGDAFEQQIYLVVESGSETPDPEPGPTALIKDGKYVIYNPGSGKAMSADATGTYYRAGKDVTVTNGKVTDPAEDLIWTVTSENGVYTITTSDGKKLSMNADRNSLPLDEVNDTWKVEKAKTDGCFYLINANRPTYYVEWFAKYTEFTTYTYKASDESVYALQFIPVDQPLVADGKYVIYNPGSGKAMSANATGTYYRAGKDVTVTNGKVDNPSADLIWTVSSTDGVYTITTSDGKKLSMNADRNSLPLDEVNDTWKVEKAKTDGCFYLINANRPTYYVEWFAKYTEFTTYTYKASDESVYALQFIPVSGSDQPSGGLPTVGDQVVIYNANAGAALAKQDDNPDSPSITKAVATIADGKLTAGNGAVIFQFRLTSSRGVLVKSVPMASFLPSAVAKV